MTGPTTPTASRWLREHLPAADYTVCASILADKDVDEMLAALSPCSARRFVATPSSNARALAGRGARRAGPARISRSSRPSPTRRARLRRAHELGEPVLVTGSLYLLADLEAADAAAMSRRSRMRERITVLTFALVVCRGIVGIAFAAGYILGKLLL